MRFRRRAKLFPGVYLNFSKSGISTTIGVPGASINIGNQGTYLNTGIPGTGFYDRQRIDGNREASQPQHFIAPLPPTEVDEPQIGTIKSERAESTTTQGLNKLRDTLLACYGERNELQIEIDKAKTQLVVASVLWVISYFIIIGIFINWFKENRKLKAEYLEDLKSQLENCFVDINMDVASEIEQSYQTLLISYKNLITSEKIWDITSSVHIDRQAERSAASKSVTRKLVKLGFNNMDIIKSKYDALHFENANGGDLFVYPAFVAIVDAQRKFGLIDLKELDFKFHSQRFVEEEKVPNDAKVIDKTWAKVNKNGTPDKRFKENYEIPVCQYGEMTFSSSTGLNEAYHISSYEKSEKFSGALTAYMTLIEA